jgi:hypothetical protein
MPRQVTLVACSGLFDGTHAARRSCADGQLGELEAKPDDKETIKTAIMDAVSRAAQVCNYCHPKLGTVKVGGDRENRSWCVTA